MNTWHNPTGKPLSSFDWLNIHHVAKFDERSLYAKRLLNRTPKTIVDLGCGPGLWLDLFDKIAPHSCEFIGIDIDADTIELARERASKWSRKATFICIDIESQVNEIPSGDLYLMFNIFSYIQNPDKFLTGLKLRFNKNGCIAVRQYDGAALRFGPLTQKDRQLIDSDLFTAVGMSKQFRHYDMDSVLSAIQRVNFTNTIVEFELFHKIAPYKPEFLKYFNNTLDWTSEFISDNAVRVIKDWRNLYLNNTSPISSYFYEVDLVVELS